MENDHFEPGAARFGNFINYYSFNPPENRIKLLPENLKLFDTLNLPILCLDIGCNSGELTRSLHGYLCESLGVKRSNSSTERTLHIIGIDIDSVLIERAKEANLNEDITYLCVDIMNDNSLDILRTYLKQYNKEQFDITFSFGVTMWIHLNNGDDGLKSFLSRMCANSKFVVLEPQPWKCYRNTVRRLKRCNQGTFTNFDKLQLRTNVQSDILEFLQNTCNCIKVFETEKTNWDRSISIFLVKHLLCGHEIL